MQVSLNIHTKLSFIQNQQDKNTINSSPNLVKRDSIQISSQARSQFSNQQKMTNSVIDLLMKQKENIEKMKSDLTNRTLENGSELTAIQGQLKELEKQIDTIDKQISEEQLNERQEKLGQSESDKEKMDKEKTDKVSPDDALANLLNTAISMDQLKQVQKVKGSVEREQRTLLSEVKLDAERSVFIDSKYDRLSDLDGKLKDISQQVSDKLEEVNQQSDVEKEEQELYEKPTILEQIQEEY